MTSNQEIIMSLPVEARQRMYHSQWYKRSKMAPEDRAGMSVQDVPISPQMISRVLNTRWQRRNYPEEKNHYPMPIGIEHDLHEGKKPSGGQKGNQNARKYLAFEDVDGYPVSHKHVANAPAGKRARFKHLRVVKKQIEISFD